MADVELLLELNRAPVDMADDRTKAACPHLLNAAAAVEDDNDRTEKPRDAILSHKSGYRPPHTMGSRIIRMSKTVQKRKRRMCRTSPQAIGCHRLLSHTEGFQKEFC